MAKTVDFEVATPMSILEPEGFMASLRTIGAAIFDSPLKKGYYVQNEGALGIKPSEQHFRAVSDNRIRYVHFDRAAEPYGSLGAEFIKLVITIDPRFQDAELIGGIDLHKVVADRLHEKIGECSVRGVNFEFDYIDDVSSQRDPSRRLFVLKKLPDVSTFDQQVIRPLEVITDCVGLVVNETAPKIFDIGDSNHGVENGLLIGYTTDLNEDRIERFKTAVTDIIFEDPVVVRAGELDIATQT